MIHVADEMERLGFKQPLLIGGATTSRAHTALKIEPQYSQATIHVVDASRAVAVASTLLSDSQSDEYKQNIKREYEALRELHKGKKSENVMIPIADARANKLAINWQGYEPPKPSLNGVMKFVDYSLAELAQYIDWTPFFATWELAGRYPNILTDAVVGASATQLFNDAQVMLQKMIDEKWLQANAVIGFFPANSVGDDIEVYADEHRRKVIARFCMLRQQTKKQAGKPNLSLADFVAPKSSGVIDYLGGFAVTAGLEMDKKLNEFAAQMDDYSSIMFKALADRLAEAFAERMHERVRKEYWCYARNETLTNQQMIAEEYVGIRPAPGYPACPDHTDKPVLFRLLNAEKNANIHLTESYAMQPAASVSGFYFSHPESKYFGIGKIGKDQVDDYAERKKMNIVVMERWLSQQLSYDARVKI
jgi:5-methyltetrahydrofolate--homocysteine methyltransferase